MWYYGVIIGVTTLVLSCLFRDSFFFPRILWMNLIHEKLDLKKKKFGKEKNESRKPLKEIYRELLH